MAIETTIEGVRVGLEMPVVVLALPVAALALGYLVLRQSEGAPERRRKLLLASRLLVVGLLVTAAAGPYTVMAQESMGEPRVTMLVDRSASTTISEDVADELAEEIEAEGVPVTERVVGSDNRSQIGDGIVSNARENGSLLVVSDGQVTHGRSLGEAAEFARELNATINAVRFSTDTTERYVRVSGPAKTSVGTPNTFFARVDGVNLDGEQELTISVDGEQVNATTLEGGGGFEFSYTFQTTGSHRITTRVEGDDAFEQNDVFHRTVRVVEPPKVLYVARNDYPFADFLEQTYDVERAREVPSDLDEYLAVVVQDMPADEIGDVNALQRYVIDGNGLVVAGGENAYGNGGYDDSPISTMLPVRNGSGGRTARIVLAIDISGSAAAGLDVQKALALDVLDQLGDRNVVGIVAFNDQVFRVADPQTLGGSRQELADRIRRLQSGGGTRIAVGLQGAGELVGGGGTIVLLSDGRDERSSPTVVAQRLGDEGTRVIAVGTGRGVNEELLQRTAAASGGTYFRADETNRLRLLFGGQSRTFDGEKLTIVDSRHFITRGVTTEARPGRTHEVTVKEGADFLVAGSSGDPAVTAWRFGLGRTVAITAYGADGTLDGLLSRPDSLLLTKSVNWAIGDPERKKTGVTDVSDARVGNPTTVTYVGESRPDSEVQFVRTGETTYEGTVVPSSQGYASVLGAEYAVNYRSEYGGFGQAPELTDAVRTTGGRMFSADEATAIARAVERQSIRVREVRSEWDWLLLAAGLLLYLLEVLARRIARLYPGLSLPSPAKG